MTKQELRIEVPEHLQPMAEKLRDCASEYGRAGFVQGPPELVQAMGELSAALRKHFKVENSASDTVAEVSRKRPYWAAITVKINEIMADAFLEKEVGERITKITANLLRSEAAKEWNAMANFLRQYGLADKKTPCPEASALECAAERLDTEPSVFRALVEGEVRAEFVTGYARAMANLEKAYGLSPCAPEEVEMTTSNGREAACAMVLNEGMLLGMDERAINSEIEGIIETAKRKETVRPQVRKT